MGPSRDRDRLTFRASLLSTHQTRTRAHAGNVTVLDVHVRGNAFVPVFHHKYSAAATVAFEWKKSGKNWAAGGRGKKGENHRAENMFDRLASVLYFMNSTDSAAVLPFLFFFDFVVRCEVIGVPVVRCVT